MNRQDRRRLRRAFERGELDEHEGRMLQAADRAAARKTRARFLLQRLDRLAEPPSPAAVRARARMVLTPAEFEAWALRMQGLSVADAAELTGKARGTITSNYARARRKLQAEFAHYDPEAA